MSAPAITSKQLTPLIERYVGPDEQALLLVRGDPTIAIPTARAHGQQVEVCASSSPLEIRAFAAGLSDRPLVIITDCEQNALGDDLTARAVRRKVLTVDVWATVRELFGAQRIAKTLAQHRELADALIDAQPAAGYRQLTAPLLDLDTAIDNLIEHYLGLGRPADSSDLLTWAIKPRAASVLRHAPADVRETLVDQLAQRFGPAVQLIAAAVEADIAPELLAHSLAVDVVFAEPVIADAPVHARLAFGDPGVGDDAYRQLGQLAARLVATAGGDDAAANDALRRADELLVAWGAAAHAGRSGVLPHAFELRLRDAATALRSWWNDLASHSAEQNAATALASVAEHRHARSDLAIGSPHRVERLRMAQRMIRRGNSEIAPGDGLADQLNRYRTDGAWLDRARVMVAQGDPDSAVNEFLFELTAWANEARTAQGAELARTTAHAAGPLPDDVLGVEQLLDRVVAPIATERPVLLAVLDGLTYSIYSRLIDELRQLGWTRQTENAGSADLPVVAALPTVTEFSRTSLLAGTIRSGDQMSEKRAFTRHSALVDSGQKNKPPRLFHKSDLRDGGLDAVPAAVLDAISDDKQAVVGVVLNNIDERLKDVDQPPRGWSINDITPLRDLLDACHRTGRAVIITADHGHVLERNTEQRPHGGGGERWRAIENAPAEEFEIEVDGPRVVTDTKRALLPWAERVHYATKRNGYHGGITLAEVVVPLAVLDWSVPDGWVESAVLAPDWWDDPVGESEHPSWLEPSEPFGAAPAAARQRKAPDPESTPSLFDAEPPAAEPSAGAAGPIADIVASEYVQSNLGRLRLDAEQLSRLLNLLNDAGGAVGEDKVARHLSIPLNRVGRLIAAVKRLLDIDGYEAIEFRDQQVRLNLQLVQTQLGL